MDKVTVSDVEPTALSEESHRRELSAPLGTANVAINRYRLAPGEGFPGGLHTHLDQEEVFVVVDGEATFETMNGTVTIGQREAIRFAPGEFQSGRNDSDGELVAFAIGAPRGTRETCIPADCPDCEHRTLGLDTTGDRLTMVCPACDSEHVPEDCPECGHDVLYTTVGEENDPIVVCEGCRAEFENPPLRDSS